MTDREETAHPLRRPVLGVTAHLPPGPGQRMQPAVRALQALNVEQVRVVLSPTPEGPESRWEGAESLVAGLARRFRVLPCVAFQDMDVAQAELGSRLARLQGPVDWVECRYDRSSTPETLCRVVEWLRRRGLRVVLGGLRAEDAAVLTALKESGVVQRIDALGLSNPAGAHEILTHWDELSSCGLPVWITEAGASTEDNDEFAQLRTLADLVDVGAERLYWCRLWDQAPSHNGNGSGRAEDAHCGLLAADGTPKLLHRIWQSQGLEGVRRFRSYSKNEQRRDQPTGQQKRRAGLVSPSSAKQPVLITGGAGFIGSNMAERLLEAGLPVILLDDLSRPGVEHNLQSLCETYGDLVEVHVGDLRNRSLVDGVIGHCGTVFHFAAQVAVTTSLKDPVADFESNLLGTLNLLEASRRLDSPPPLLFTSTSKVYGDLSDVFLVRVKNRCAPRDTDLRAHGVNESRALDFHSPFGCSKGAADQYVLDYARMYGMPNTVFRLSCIYGRRQCGTEDQGWVAHFAREMLRTGRLNIYGDGRQVRDILYIDDLIDAMLLAMERIDAVAGKAFNVGGGPANAVSLREVIDSLSTLSGVKPELSFSPARKGDQPYYVSDTRRLTREIGWTPKISVEQGVPLLYHWICENTQTGARQTKR
jgi:CDP-paratose 2-epimerase